MATILHADVEAFVAGIRNLAPNTVKTYVSRVSGVFTMAVSALYIPRNPASASGCRRYGALERSSRSRSTRFTGSSTPRRTGSKWPSSSVPVWESGRARCEV